MKKLLTLTAVGAILAAPATAVQQCIALGADYECYVSFNGPGEAITKGQCSTADYSLDSPYGPNVNVTLIGLCAVTDGGTQNTVQRLISTGTFYDNGSYDTYGIAKRNHCWCKMIQPMVSMWVYYGEIDAATGGMDIYGHSDTCAATCSDMCSNYFEPNAGRALDVFLNNPDNQ